MFLLYVWLFMMIILKLRRVPPRSSYAHRAFLSRNQFPFPYHKSILPLASIYFYNKVWMFLFAFRFYQLLFERPVVFMTFYYHSFSREDLCNAFLDIGKRFQNFKHKTVFLTCTLKNDKINFPVFRYLIWIKNNEYNLKYVSAGSL